MILRTTTDPISLKEVIDPENHPCIFDGDGDNGIEIYFENENNRQIYLNMSDDHQIVLQGNDSANYIAEG